MSDNPGSITTIYTLNNAVVQGPLPDTELWPSLYNPTLALEDLSVECDSSSKVAEDILDLYNIEYDDLSGAGAGGDLESLDIKRMDAMTAINWSLMERGAKSGREFIEPIMSPEGVVEFREIGRYDARIDDIYYEISTGSFTESPKAVMVTGGRPLPYVRPMQWYPIWGDNAVRVYHQDEMFKNCRRDDYIRFAHIVFKDPQTTSTYNDGIENLYEINDDNPWDRIAGYVTYINPGPEATDETKVTYSDNATIFIQIGGGDNPEMGNMQIRPTYDDLNTLNDAECLSPEEGEEVSFSDGIIVEIPDDIRYTDIRGVPRDAFSKISDVYLIGKEIDALLLKPLNAAAQLLGPTTDNSISMFSINKTETKTFRLDPGKHYVVAYEEGPSGPIPYIVFIKNAHPKDPFTYGKNHTMYPNPYCTWAKEKGLTAEDVVEEYTVYPDEIFHGVLVHQIWVSVDLNIPSVSVYDPDGTNSKAINIATNLRYYISPIIITEEPAPIAYAGPSTGGSADLVDQMPPTDNDPLTAQNFDDREIEQYLDEMQGGGMSITFSFLDEESVIGMANMLYNHFQSDVVETVYTCGPDCNPILGGYGERGGVVNSIRYNYSDSGSYTVSVTEGPKLVGNLTPVDGGPSMKMAENFNSSGVVIDQLGDNIHFKVRIDGYGERWAINMAPTIIRMKDIVSCTVHNNPVEA